jgi:hypothetical protein
MRTESNIYRPPIKAFSELEIIFANTDLNLLARTLEMSTPPTKLIGLKSFTSTASAFLGIRKTNIALKLFSNWRLLCSAWKKQTKQTNSKQTLRLSLMLEQLGTYKHNDRFYIKKKN